MQKVLAFQQWHLGRDHPQVAMMLGNISNLSREHGKLPEALNTLKKVLAIFKQVHSRNHPLVAMTYNK